METPLDQPLHILLAVQDERARSRLNDSLLRHGAQVSAASSVRAAMDLVVATGPDALIVDGSLDRDRAAQIRGYLAAETDTAIIVLGGDDRERLEALLSGADDCVSADCPADELIARAMALRRRIASTARREALRAGARCAFAGYRYCRPSRHLRRPGGEVVVLSPVLAQILGHFLSRPQQWLTPSALGIAGRPGGLSAGGVRVSIHRLRRILGESDDAGAALIESGHGGYKFTAHVTPSADEIRSDRLDEAA